MRINQQDNFSANFGKVFRSSAIFYAVHDDKVKTTISFLNYWDLKNKIATQAMINLRKIDGALVSRELVDFNRGEVFNFTVPYGFEGSLEVEVFSAIDMRIPYAAVTAMYECQNSISMVHSYSRTYSQLEIEDNRVITEGAESCWTIREDNSTTSFCIFHNGPLSYPSQEITFSIRNSFGDVLTKKLMIDELKPFETKVIKPREIIPQIAEWLNGNPGQGKLRFNVYGAFTRLLCGISKTDGSALHVTHSNFDYSHHETNYLNSLEEIGFMKTPNIKGIKSQNVVIYPDCADGYFKVKGRDVSFDFSHGETVVLEQNSSGSMTYAFQSSERLPSRIVTGLRLYPFRDSLPAECSLGMVHSMEPAKHFHWMVTSQCFATIIYWVTYEEIFGPIPANSELVFNLYTESRREPFTKRYLFAEVSEAGSLDPRIMFEDVESIATYSYLTVWSSYAGMVFYTSLWKEGRVTIEHSF
jgi:hypothetical protein